MHFNIAHKFANTFDPKLCSCVASVRVRLPGDHRDYEANHRTVLVKRRQFDSAYNAEKLSMI